MPSILNHTVYFGQLRESDRILGFGHPVIEPDPHHPCPVSSIYVSECLQLPDLLREFLVIRCHGAALAEAGHVLVALKTVTRGLSPAANRAAPEPGAHRMRRIVNHRHARFY